MQVNNDQVSDTKRKLTIATEQTDLNDIKQAVLKRLRSEVKVPGFRPGKAPLNLVEKNVSSSILQTEFLDHAVNELYSNAIQQTDIRPVAQPEITITKFVPFSTLEFTAQVEAIGKVTLEDYKKIKLPLKQTPITTKNVDQVLDNLRNRAAAKEAVKRAAKKGDEVIIDFSGIDTKTKETISGADGKDYPLQIGSDTFIPGFEENIVGLKADDKKTFDIVFPKDYSVKSLQKRKVTFSVTVKKVQAVKEPALDDAFAKTVGPFETLKDLKADIKKQLETERQREDLRNYDNELLKLISDKSSVAIPASLVEEEIDRLEEEEKRNVAYRGQTWKEHLESEGLTAEGHREKQREIAESRVKAGIILSEIAKQENVTITSEELEVRIQLLKGQYNDAAMQAELDKIENRRDILSRMLTEKTIDQLRTFATA